MRDIWKLPVGVRGAAGFVIAMLTYGCSAPVSEQSTVDEADTAIEQPLLSCQGLSCDGLRPSDTPCKLDMRDTGVGAPIRDAAGTIIGGIGLFESRSCQTVWAAASFYVSGGPRSYKICAVRRRATDNDASCFDYSASFGNDSPMKFANSGKTVFGRITTSAITTRTPDYTVP